MSSIDISGRPFVTTTEAGFLSDLSSARIHQLIQEGVLPARKWGRRTLVNREALESWLAERKELLGR